MSEPTPIPAGNEQAWNAAVKRAEGEIGQDFREAVFRDTTYPRHIAKALYELDHGPKIAYHLANHPEELKKLEQMSPARATAQLGRIEAQLAAPKAQAAPKAAAPAPKPESTSDWIRNRNQQLRNQR